ncbi:MAG: hypothetical protein ACLQVL_21185 [Terriglobia bacterium]
MNTLSMVATLLFGALSIVLYFRGRRQKRLTFTFDQTTLITKAHPEIKITFRDRQVANLSRLRTVCWNSGNQEIRWVDIPDNSPPTVLFSGATVLSVAAVAATAGTGFVAKHENDHSVSTKFDFLNPGDCGFFEVLYESLPSEKFGVQFLARIIGGRSTDSRPFGGRLTPFESVAAIALPLIWIATAYLWAAPIRRSISPVPNGIAIRDPAAAQILLLMGGLIACIFVLQRYFRRFHQSRVPKIAKEFFERAP